MAQSAISHFEGEGCAISLSSASMMTELLKGRKGNDATLMMEAFIDLVKTGDSSVLRNMDHEAAGTLEVLSGVSQFPTRVKCATLPWHTFLAALKSDITDEKTSVTTETTKWSEGAIMSETAEEQVDEIDRSHKIDPDALFQPVIDAIKTVYDPEIPVDVYELGLIYRLDISEFGEVDCDMTLTAPNCPVADQIPMWVHNAISTVDAVQSVHVELVFDPPWTPERMSEAAKLELNMF